MGNNHEKNDSPAFFSISKKNGSKTFKDPRKNADRVGVYPYPPVLAQVGGCPPLILCGGWDIHD